MPRLSVGRRANNGHPACVLTFNIRGRTFKVGAWAYGWENPSYYKRFDHVRFMAATWHSEKAQATPWKIGQWYRKGDSYSKVPYPGMQRGLDKTVVLRTDGRWHRPHLHA